MRLGRFVSVFAALLISTVALAGDRGTRDEAKAMAEKAVAHYGQAGAAALADFNKPEWRDRDLYVIAMKNDGTLLVNSGTPALVGRNVFALRDVDGKQFIQEMVAVKDRAWVEYKWRNPQTQAVENKATYVVRAGEDLTLSVGAYQ